jgi:hypothetical protein
MYFTNVVDWIQLAQDRIDYRVLVNKVVRNVCFIFLKLTGTTDINETYQWQGFSSLYGVEFWITLYPIRRSNFLAIPFYPWSKMHCYVTKSKDLFYWLMDRFCKSTNNARRMILRDLFLTRRKVEHYFSRKLQPVSAAGHALRYVHNTRLLLQPLIRGCIQKFPNWVYNEITTNTRWEATQRVMATKLTRLTHKIAIQLHLMTEICTIWCSRSRRPVRKLLDTPSYSYTLYRYPSNCMEESPSCEANSRSADQETSRLLWSPKRHYRFQKNCVQNGSGAHPASYPMGTRGSFPGGKAVGAWRWPLTSI